jgi:chromosome segregation ATPase
MEGWDDDEMNNLSPATEEEPNVLSQGIQMSAFAMPAPTVRPDMERFQAMIANQEALLEEKLGGILKQMDAIKNENKKLKKTIFAMQGSMFGMAEKRRKLDADVKRHEEAIRFLEAHNDTTRIATLAHRATNFEKRLGELEEKQEL